MKLSTDQVTKVATLANLTLTIDEQDKYSEQISAILDYVDQLNTVATDDVLPTYNVFPCKNVLDNDQQMSSLSQDDALQNAVHQENGLFVTKGVFDNE